MSRAKTASEVLRDNARQSQSGCIEWQGHLDKNGYGKVKRDGFSLAHRLAWATLVGPIPTGLQIDHLCKNRRCINTAHLEVVTPYENMKRSDVWAVHPNAIKTHCKRGHEFVPSNTAIEVYGDRQQRKCRQCRQDAQRDRAAKLRLSVFRSCYPELRVVIS